MAPNAGNEGNTQYSYTEDQSQDAGTVFWNSIDPLLRKKLESQLVYIAQKSDYTTEDALSELNLMCNHQKHMLDTTPKRRVTSEIPDLTSSNEAFDAISKQKLAELGLPTVQQETLMEEEDPFEATERLRFMKQYLLSGNASIDASPVTGFISHLYGRLHRLYGRGTKVLYNEFGGFDFRDSKTSELVTEFNNFRNRFTYEFSEICEYILNQNRQVALSFAAVSSDMFRDEINKVYQAAE